MSTRTASTRRQGDEIPISRAGPFGALVAYYDATAKAKRRDSSEPIPPFGYSIQQISFVIVLNKDGTPAKEGPRKDGIVDARVEEPPASGKGKPRLFKRAVAVPGLGKPSGSGINPCFLWDNAAYMLGFTPKGEAAGKRDRARRCFEAFRDRHLELESVLRDDGFRAVCRFLRDWNPRDAAGHELLEELAGGFGVFRLRADEEYVHEREAIIAHWDEHGATPDYDADDEADGEGDGEPTGVVGVSLLSGRREPVARLHKPAIKGVAGAQSTGARLASFNCAAFTSYGKSQTYNAPIGVRDAFKYCTALNRLLADPRHHACMGDSTVTFWTAAPGADDACAAIGWMLDSQPQDEHLRGRLEDMLSRARRGLPTDLGDPATPFFILGLAPNIARLSVRFWVCSSAGEVLAHVARHADALALDGAPEGYLSPTLTQILAETVPAKSGRPDLERLPARAVGEFARTVFLGLPYPPALLGAVLHRVRTDGWVNTDERFERETVVAHRRASIIAACLRRLPPSLSAQPLEVPMSLQEDHPECSYQLGRLFAVLDKIAEDASDRNVNRRDKYFASGSSNPSSVFPRLIRMSNFDLKKLGADKPGYRVSSEKHLQSICDRIDAFPSLLDLRQQGLFCLGFYQQRQSLFTRKDADAATADAES